MKEALDEDGVFIVEDVLTLEFVEEMKQEILGVMETISNGKFIRSDPTTWMKTNLPPNTRGLFQHYGIGTQHFGVKIRAKVKHVFETFYGTNELWTSFDGVSFEPRPKQFLYKTIEDWERNPRDDLHVDQTSPGFQCLQSGICLEDQSIDSRTFVCIPKSHLLHSDVMTLACGNNPWPTTNWLKISKDVLDGIDNPPLVRIPLKAGSMVCWDSRTIHSSAGPCKTMNKPFRMQVFVCMKPIPTDDKVYEKERAKRIGYFESGRTSRHTPVPISVFGTNPRSYTGQKYPRLDPYLDMTKEEKQMHGLEDYL